MSRYSAYRPVPERAVRTTYPTPQTWNVDSLRRARHPQESTGWGRCGINRLRRHEPDLPRNAPNSLNGLNGGSNQLRFNLRAPLEGEGFKETILATAPGQNEISFIGAETGASPDSEWIIRANSR